MTIDTTRLAELDLYDPEADDSPDRLELLQYLISLGACEEDVLAYRDQLAGLASVLAIRGGRALAPAEVVERTGAPEEKLRRLDRAAGFPDPGPETTGSSASSSANEKAGLAIRGIARTAGDSASSGDVGQAPRKGSQRDSSGFRPGARRYAR